MINRDHSLVSDGDLMQTTPTNMELNEEELREERELLMALADANMKALVKLYKLFGEDLLIFAYSRLQNARMAVEAVEDLFETVWLTADFLTIQPPIYKYLVTEMEKLCDQKSTH
jgi:hypothetical protein